MTNSEKQNLSNWLTIAILLLCVGSGGLESGFWGAVSGAGLGLVLIILYDIFLEKKLLERL